MKYPRDVQSIIALLDDAEIEYQLRTFQEPAHHAIEAADLLGCPLGAVVKSLIFQKDSTGEILLVLASGENRVDLNKLSEIIEGVAHPASPQDVKQQTGYPVGAVPPFGLADAFPVYIDEDFQGYDIVWSSAGAVNILLGLKFEQLKSLTGGQIVNIKKVS